MVSRVGLAERVERRADMQPMVERVLTQPKRAGARGTAGVVSEVVPAVTGTRGIRFGFLGG